MRVWGTCGSSQLRGPAPVLISGTNSAANPLTSRYTRCSLPLLGDQQTVSGHPREGLWIGRRVTQKAQPSAGLPVRVRKAHHLWVVANYMVAAHDEVGHRDVRILEEFPKR
jgi:hypothetical protein